MITYRVMISVDCSVDINTKCLQFIAQTIQNKAIYQVSAYPLPMKKVCG